MRKYHHQQSDRVNDGFHKQPITGKQLNLAMLCYDQPYLHHLPSQQAVLNDGRSEALVGTTVAKLAIPIMPPAIQLT